MAIGHAVSQRLKGAPVLKDSELRPDDVGHWLAPSNRTSDAIGFTRSRSRISS
jgi:hypothetical protein